METTSSLKDASKCKSSPVNRSFCRVVWIKKIIKKQGNHLSSLGHYYVIINKRNRFISLSGGYHMQVDAGNNW